MTPDLFPQILSAFALLGAATALGIWPVRKLIQVSEAKHELKHGSAGFIRTVSGWSVIALWLMATWFTATIIGDWGATGDLSGAMDRGWLRFRILLEIAVALMESD